MEDYLLIVFLILILIFCCLYQVNKPPVSGTVIDKYITYGRYGSGPHYYITIKTDKETFNKNINHYDYYNGYFVGGTYEF